MLAALTLTSQIALAGIPGVQLVGVFVAVITLTYRVRALIPIYTYIMLYCTLHPTLWSVPYLYIWLPLWAMFLFAGKLPLPKRAKVPLYMVLCGLYGLSFGLLYAPYQAWIMGWDGELMILWWKAGLPFDVAHAVNNFALGVLILPLSLLLNRLKKSDTA
jgi:energy-coupling factor transport system substrate-specific component